ncbi:MAG: hypothetical protein QXF52_07125 [Thermoproteota archaeon]
MILKLGVLKKYGVWKRKNFYGKTFMRVKRTTFLIDEEGRIKIYSNVKPKEHAQTCLLDLKSLNKRVNKCETEGKARLITFQSNSPSEALVNE